MDTNERFLQSLNIITDNCEIASSLVTETTTALVLPYTLPYYTTDGVVVDKGLPTRFSSLYLPLALGRVEALGDKWLLQNKRFHDKTLYVPERITASHRDAPIFTFQPGDPYHAESLTSPHSWMEWTPCNITIFAGIAVALRRGYPCPIHDGIPKLFIVRGIDADNRLRSLISGRLARGGVRFSGFTGLAQQYLVTLAVRRTARSSKKDVLSHDFIGIDITEAHGPEDAEMSHICREIYLNGIEYMQKIDLVESLNIFASEDVHDLISLTLAQTE